MKDPSHMVFKLAKILSYCLITCSAFLDSFHFKCLQSTDLRKSSVWHNSTQIYLKIIWILWNRIHLYQHLGSVLCNCDINSEPNFSEEKNLKVRKSGIFPSVFCGFWLHVLEPQWNQVISALEWFTVCAGLTWAGCQVLTKPFSPSHSKSRKGGENTMKSLWVKTRTGRLLMCYHHRRRRQKLGKLI